MCVIIIIVILGDFVNWNHRSGDSHSGSHDLNWQDLNVHVNELDLESFDRYYMYAGIKHVRWTSVNISKVNSKLRLDNLSEI